MKTTSVILIIALLGAAFAVDQYRLQYSQFGEFDTTCAGDTTYTSGTLSTANTAGAAGTYTTCINVAGFTTPIQLKFNGGFTAILQDQTCGAACASCAAAASPVTVYSGKSFFAAGQLVTVTWTETWVITSATFGTATSACAGALNPTTSANGIISDGTNFARLGLDGTTVKVQPCTANRITACSGTFVAIPVSTAATPCAFVNGVSGMSLGYTTNLPTVAIAVTTVVVARVASTTAPTITSGASCISVGGGLYVKVVYSGNLKALALPGCTDNACTTGCAAAASAVPVTSGTTFLASGRSLTLSWFDKWTAANIDVGTVASTCTTTATAVNEISGEFSIGAAIHTLYIDAAGVVKVKSCASSGTCAGTEALTISATCTQVGSVTTTHVKYGAAAPTLAVTITGYTIDAFMIASADIKSDNWCLQLETSQYVKVVVAAGVFTVADCTTSATCATCTAASSALTSGTCTGAVFGKRNLKFWWKQDMETAIVGNSYLSSDATCTGTASAGTFTEVPAASKIYCVAIASGTGLNAYYKVTQNSAKFATVSSCLSACTTAFTSCLSSEQSTLVMNGACTAVGSGNYVKIAWPIPDPTNTNTVTNTNTNVAGACSAGILSYVAVLALALLALLF